METLVLERNNRIFLTGQAQVVEATDEVSEDVAAAVTDWKVEKSNPFIKWITGNFVEADKANENNQFWTKGGLELGEYSIRYAPLNMVHKVRQPVGFFLATRMVDLTKTKGKAKDQAELERDEELAKLLRSGGFDSEAEQVEQEIAKAKVTEPSGTAKIEAMSGMWTHVFPFESALVNQAHASKALFYSMECRGTHLICSGDNGCGTQFEYMDFENHCEHLKERASMRHIVNPTFRGGALIIPPFKPGWKEATATIQSKAVMQEAAKFAEQTEASYEAATKDSDLTPGAWEHLMAAIIGLADA